MTSEILRTADSMGSRRAFSLVEAVFVVAIIGVLSSIALPHYAGFVAREQIHAAARRIESDLALAQRQARLSSASQQIVFNVVAGTYTLVDLPDPDRHGQTYQVSLTKEPYGANIVSANFGGDATLIYDGFGTPDSSGSVVIGVGKYRQTITVNAGTGKAIKSQELLIVEIN